jgi:hypothetical protein
MIKWPEARMSPVLILDPAEQHHIRDLVDAAKLRSAWPSGCD